MEGPKGEEVLDGVAEVMDLDFPLEDSDWAMMVDGPAEDQLNEILSKEVLQQLGLFGTPADSPEPALGTAVEAGGPAPGATPGGGTLKEVPLLLQQPGGGLSGLGNAAKQVAELLAGTHPSMRGTTLEDWLAADGPIIAITNSGIPDMATAAAASMAAAARSSPQGAQAADSPGGQAGSPLTVGSMAGTQVGSIGSTPAGMTPAVSSGLPAGPASSAMALQDQLQLLVGMTSGDAAQQAQQAQYAQQAQQAQQAAADFSMDAFFAGLAQAAGVPQTWQPSAEPAAQPSYYPQQGQQQAAPQSQPAMDLLTMLNSVVVGGGAGASSAPPGGITDFAFDAAALQHDPAAAGGPLLQQLLTELSGLRDFEPHLPPLAGAATTEATVAAAPAPSVTPSVSLGMPRTAMEEDDSDVLSSGALFTPGVDAKPAALKRLSHRQQHKIAQIEQELAKLQRDMHQMKLENARLKSKNVLVEQQLRTQQQLQQLAAAVTSATAAAAAASEQQQRPHGQGGAPSLGMGSGVSPPNSQKKLLLQLSDSMRPQDREMMAVAALTWPKLQDWYIKQVARFKDALTKAATLGAEDAERGAKEALRTGRYWDLLVLISRPDLSARLLAENMVGGGAAAAAAGGSGAASWAEAAVDAMGLSAEQRSALTTAWQRHRVASEQRAAKRQELLSAIRHGFLVHLQKASPEDIELGKPLARQGLSAMEALRLVVRQEHVSAVQVSCGLRKVLTSMQQAQLAVAAWPWYPDPAKWAPLLS